MRRAVLSSSGLALLTLNFFGQNKETPLHIAARLGHKDFVATLLVVGKANIWKDNKVHSSHATSDESRCRAEKDQSRTLTAYTASIKSHFPVDAAGS